MTDTDWPYDAIEDDPLAALRIAVVASPYPAWKYEVAVLITDGRWGPALRPDNAEVHQIVAYLGYKMDYYNAGWRAKMARQPLDVDSSATTVMLCKRAEGDWAYRHSSWRTGPFMIPVAGGKERLNLEPLLDRINGLGSTGAEPNPKWLAWKAAHPEAFPEPCRRLT